MTVAAATISGVRALGVSWVMSSPTSCRDSADRALTAVPGLVPAEVTVTVSPAAFFVRPAAMGDFPPFFTQTNSTVGRWVIGVLRGCRRRPVRR